MKMLILSVWLVVTTSAAYCQVHGTDAPPCTDPDCIGRQFKYRFCNEFGRMVEKCSADPNNDKEINPPLRPAKKSTPLCFDADFRDIPFQQIILDPSTDTHPGANVSVFDQQDLYLQLDAAAHEWTNMCPATQGPNQEYQRCCVKVRFSEPETNFTGLPKDKTRAFVHDPPEDFVGKPSYCRTDCYASELILNSESEFMQPDEDGRPTVFFFTRNLDALKQLGPNLQYASAYSILLHEIGHWLGLGHNSGFDGFGHYCRAGESIMDEGDVGDWNQVERHTTDLDRCFFMKLYCCNSSADKLEVDKGATIANKYNFDVIPNPLHGNLLTVKLNEGIKGHVARLRVLNSVGDAVLDCSVSREEIEPAVDATGWASGVYFVEVIHDKGIAGRKLIIQR